MSATIPKTIVLTSVAGRAEEALAGGVIIPGELVVLGSAGTYTRQPIVSAQVEAIFAKEDALQGRSIDTAYANAERVFMHVGSPGDVIYAWLAPGHATSVGTKLTSSINGTLEVAAVSADEPLIAVALEALSVNGAANQRIKVRLM